MVSNRHMLIFVDPLCLPAAATSPEFGGGREGGAWKITFKDEFTNSANHLLDPVQSCPVFDVTDGSLC